MTIAWKMEDYPRLERRRRMRRRSQSNRGYVALALSPCLHSHHTPHSHSQCTKPHHNYYFLTNTTHLGIQTCLAFILPFTFFHNFIYHHHLPSCSTPPSSLLSLSPLLPPLSPDWLGWLDGWLSHLHSRSSYEVLGHHSTNHRHRQSSFHHWAVGLQLQTG